MVHYQLLALYNVHVHKLIIIASIDHAYLPYLGAQLEWWYFKSQHKLEPPEESLVQVINEVGGKNDDTREPLNVVEKNTHINIGIAVSGSPVQEQDLVE